MRTFALLLLSLLAGCTSDQDRLTDEEATRDPVANEPTVAFDGSNDGPNGVSLPDGPGEILYRAVGTEPGWALTIRRNVMLYQGDYGTTRVVEATPPTFRPDAGTTRTGRLTITIARGPCSDGMSDHLWRNRVTVALAGGRTAQGCGGGLLATVDPNAIEGPRYRVAAINGAPVRTASGWWLVFTGGRVSGQFGCSVFGAPYSRNGDHLSLTGGIEQNLMRCPSIEAWERAGKRVLQSNARIERLGGGVRLVSEAGTIDLVQQQEVPST